MVNNRIAETHNERILMPQGGATKAIDGAVRIQSGHAQWTQDYGSGAS